MKRFAAPLIVAAFVGACAGSTGKDNPHQDDPDETATEEPAEATGINEALSKNVSSMSVPGAAEITVQIASLDGTPLASTFTRNAALDTAGYLAYTTQEDPLDRMFVALAAQSLDGSVHAGVAQDGGQFNRFFSGGFYERDGDFDAPEIGAGPGEGQVSYAGRYAGLSNVGSTDGAQLLDLPAGVDPTLLPDLPAEPGRVAGTIFLNANFADNSVNGDIINRVLISPVDGATLALEDLSLIASEIDDNGEFFGDVEITGEVGQGVGSYGGIFGGDGASSVAGLVAIADYIDGIDNEEEIGVFVLTQCGQDGDAAVCDLVAP